MKKTLTVNLANQVFHMDEDAYFRLKEYLDRIEGHFSNQEERKDIVSDIESRISELFGERISAEKQVITLREIEEVIRTMGEPVEIGGGTESEPESKSAIPGPKRLYRDPDNRVLGGICGGIGLYFKLDPLIIRVIFLLVFLGFGIGLLIYIILWIIVPEARTTAQKIEMRGEPVNASTIGTFMRDEYENVKKTFKGRKK